MKQAIAIVGALAIGAFGGYQMGYSKGEAASNRAHQRAAQEKKLAGPWAKVERSIELAPGETFRQISVTNQLSPGFMDPRCLLYTNTETKASSIACPGVDQISLALDD